MSNNTKEVVIKVLDLGKSYGSNEVLKGISLDVYKKEVICLIGPSGSGKSTLLRCMAFLEQYNTGRVIIEGELLGYEITDSKRVLTSEKQLKKTREKLGFVFQHFNLWPHKTVMENITLPLTLTRGLSKDDAIRKAEIMLDKVGLSQLSQSYPAHLSGGQKQRVAIARALATEPDYMLFDEPTSALDPELVGEVLQVMRELAEDGMTMIIVTHEMGFAAKVADRVAFLDGGKLVAVDTPAKVFRENDHPRLKSFLKSIVERNAIWVD